MNSKEIARYGIVAALVTVGILIDTLISSFGLPINVAIGTIVIVLVICQSFDLKTAVFASTVFGILSLIRAFVFPNLTSPLFQKPLVSVLPRICIGFTCHLSFLGFKKIFKQKDFRLYLPYIFSGAIGVITNTALVLTMMSVVDNSMLAKVIGIIISFNFLIEFLCGLMVVPTISRVLQRVRKNTDNKNDNTLIDSAPDNKNDLTDKDI